MKFTSIALVALINSTSAVKLEEAREPLLTWAPKEPASHPVDYPVPNFGVDHDMLDQEKNLKESEKKLGPWNLKELPKIKRDYFVPNFGMDVDVKDSQSSE